MVPTTNDLSEFTIEPFDGTNYEAWKWHMELYFKQQKLLDIVDGTKTTHSADIENKINLIMAQSMTREQLVHVMALPTAASKWSSLKNTHQSSISDGKHRAALDVGNWYVMVRNKQCLVKPHVELPLSSTKSQPDSNVEEVAHSVQKNNDSEEELTTPKPSQESLSLSPQLPTSFSCLQSLVHLEHESQTHPRVDLPSSSTYSKPGSIVEEVTHPARKEKSDSEEEFTTPESNQGSLSPASPQLPTSSPAFQKSTRVEKAVNYNERLPRVTPSINLASHVLTAAGNLGTLSPVSSYDAIQTLLFLSSQWSMDINQFDVETAFVIGVLEIGSQASQLHKSSCSLKQAGRSWKQRLKEVLLKFGLKQSLSDPCRFFSRAHDRFLLIHLLKFKSWYYKFHRF